MFEKPVSSGICVTAASHARAKLSALVFAPRMTTPPHSWHVDITLDANRARARRQKRLDAARMNGVNITALAICQNPPNPVGVCRLCVVDMARASRGLLRAPVSSRGMKVVTNSEKV